MVNEGEIQNGDLLVRHGRIAKIASSISAPAQCMVLDAAGAHLLPGMIDDQVHFREPGLTHKAGIWSESRAAVAGGITSFMEMPNTLPPTVTLEALEDKYAIGAEKSLANYAFYLGATNDNLDVIRALPPGVACGIKIFMGASTGNMLVDNEETLAGIFRDAPTLIATHCESTPLIQQNLQQAIEKYGRDIPLSEHPLIRSAEACYASSSTAIALAREYDAQLHVLHLTTAEDRAALRKALKEGRLDIIATDHAPHTAEEKASTDYLKAPVGLPLVQDALLCVFEMFHDGVLTLEDIVTKTAHNPAIRFGVQGRGYLREGYWADLVIVDTEKCTEVKRENVLSKCGWSPFEGRTFRSRIATTLVNGTISWHHGAIVENHAAARLSFK